MDNQKALSDLADYLADPKNTKTRSTGTAPTNWLVSVVDIGKGLHYMYVCPAAYPGRIDVYGDGGIAIEFNSDGEYAFIPLNQFKPEYQKHIIKEVARSRALNVFEGLTKIRQELIDKIKSEASPA